MQEVQGFIVLLDISGYTRYIRSHNLRFIPGLGKHFRETSEAHAEKVITDLLETLINATSQLLHPEKLEGDAVLLTAVVEDEAAFARELVGCLEQVFRAFHTRLYELMFCRTCLCDCCSQMELLKVKAIAHYGPYLLKTVAGFREIAGQEVIRAHRLLKNEVDSNEYLMLTDAVATLADATSQIEMSAHEEMDPNLGATKVWVHFPKDYSQMSQPHTEPYFSRLGQMQGYFKEPSERAGLIPAAK
jgi:hypothetical protein